jgi:hypothetical protein
MGILGDGLEIQPGRVGADRGKDRAYAPVPWARRASASAAAGVFRRLGPPAVIAPCCACWGRASGRLRSTARLRLGWVQRHHYQGDPQLVDTVPRQAVSGECLAQRRACPGRGSAADGLARPGPTE